MTTARGTIVHNNWNEKPYHEAPPQKSTEALIDCSFGGDLVATANTRFLMQYPTASICHYAGYLLVEGTLGGRDGSFMIYEQGEWRDGVASSNWQIVPGSGTGALTGLTGTGRYAAEHDKTVHYELNYEVG
jgi:hypothetical protein